MLRSIEDSDFEWLYNMYFHPEINPFLLYDTMSKDAFLPIFSDLKTRKIMYVFEEKDIKIGMVKLIPREYRSAHIVYIGGVAISPDKRKLGFGKKMFLEIIQHCKNNNFTRLELSVSTQNKNAIQLYSSIGFEYEGTMRNFTFIKNENRFIDEQMMALIL